MPPYPQFWLGDDSAQVTAAISASQDSGTTYGPVTYHLFNDRGGSLNATSLRNLRIVPKVFNGSARVSSGFPILDESWVQIQVSGKNNTGDSTMEDQTTGFVPVGAGNPLLLKDIPKNCARFLDVKIVVPAGAGNLSQELYLELVYDETSVPTPYRIGALLGPGILPDWVDVSARRIRRGFAITASGGQTVDVLDGSYAFDGTSTNVIKTTLTLNQTANDGALTAGQSYIAVISVANASAPHATKGNRGASPSAPALPANEILIGKVTVVYQGGGTSIINTGNVDQSGLVYGEYLVTAGTGLTVNVGAGIAVTSNDTQTFNSSKSTLAVADNTANQRIWLRSDGSLSVSTTSPAIGAIGLAIVAASAGAITSVVDVRPFIGRAINEVQVCLKFYGPPVSAFAGNPQVSTEFLTDAWAQFSQSPSSFILDSVDFEIGSLGAGASAGQFKADVFYWNPGVSTATGPTTIYINSGTQDLRPTIAYNASSLRSTGNRGHEANIFQSGARFSAQLVEIPSGTFTTEAQDWFIVLHFRKL